MLLNPYTNYSQLYLYSTTQNIYIYIYACINLSKLLILLLLLLTTYKFLFKNNTNPFINQTDLSLTTDFSSRFPDFSPQTNRNQRRGRIRIRTCFRRASHELGTSIVLQTIWNFLVQRDFDLELLSCSFGDKDRSSTFLNGKLANSFWPIFLLFIILAYYQIAIACCLIHFRESAWLDVILIFSACSRTLLCCFKTRLVHMFRN